MNAKEKKDKDIRQIYALGRQLGIHDRSLGHDDELHVLVEGVTGCSSIGDLSDAERWAVIQELTRGKNAANIPAMKSKRKKMSYRPGMATPGQIDKLWWQIYELQKYDTGPSAPVNLRLKGAINAFLKVDASASNPCAWLTGAQAHRLIEMLKNCIETEKNKYARSQTTRQKSGGGT